MGIFGVLVDEVIETVTLSLSRVPLKWSAKSFSSNCSQYFDNSSIISRVFVYFTSLVFIYLIFAKCLQGLLKRMELSEVNRSHLVEATWYAGFCAASIVVCVAKFIMNDNIQTLETAFHIFSKERLFVSENVVPNDLTFMFIICCALHAHSVCLAWNKKGSDLEFLTRLCFLIFFSSTYPLRCVLLGLVCILAINVNTLCADITRICCVLGRKKSCQIYSMKYIAYVFFSLHCIFWSVMFLYLLPTQVLWATLNMQASRTNLPALLLLNLTLWSFMWLQICSAPLPKFVWNWLWGWFHSAGQRDLLDCSLFPSRNEVVHELKLIRSRVHKLQEQRRISAPASLSPMLDQRELQAHKRTIYQTVKCVIALKRRLRQNRERKMAHLLSTEAND